MKLLFFILLILLIVHIGFWGTLGAVLGAAVMFVLLFALGIGVIVVGVLALVATSLR